MVTKKVLASVNLPILVRVLTHNGPEYWVKELTMKCYRHSSILYYTPKFADLFFSLLLINEGRIQKCVDALYFIFGNSNTVGDLLPSYKDVWTNIASDILNQGILNEKILQLKVKAAANGEYGVVSHDETFKTLFCIIGQKKMSQNKGEFHALHTFRGFTGLTIGMSAQRSTSKDCFVSAVSDTFDQNLASKVYFLFSDAPTRIYNAARSVFKSLIAIGEDPMHLVFRLEYCLGGKRIGPSLRVMELHRKFRVASSSSVPFYIHNDKNLVSIK